MISLRITEISANYASKGYARISEQNMQELGISSWDLIEIGGKRKTVARAIPLENANGDSESVIEVDVVTRDNARVRIDDFVVVKKAESRNATKVTLAPRNKTLLYNNDHQKFLNTRLNGIPITVGDRVSVNFPGSKIEDFDVLSTLPSNSVVVSNSTKLDIRRRRQNKELSTKLSYEDIGGLDEQIIKIKEMIELPIKYPQIFDRLGIDPPRGVLLIGPTGSGKTLIARAIAHETNANFQVINGPEIIHKFYGESEARIRDIFDVATRNQPSIIFLDELDAIAPKREKANGDVEKRVVAQLLTLMDGLKERGNVIVIGATNLPDVIDPSLRRPGRFDREIVLDVPDRNSRTKIMKIHSRNMPLSEDVDYDKLSDLTQGFVGADLENLCREAAMKSLRRTVPDFGIDDNYSDINNIKPLTVKMDDFLEALKDVEPSAIKEILIEIPKVSWGDVGGLEQIKEKLTECVIMPLKHKNLFDAANIKAPKGVLLSGQPGTGKTLLAKALANESNVNFISVKAAELISKYVGDSERAVREIFKKAKQVAPCIIFFDEIDALAPARSNADTNNVSERVVSQLLTEIDGIEELVDVYVLAATNRIDIIDRALLRSGRFDMIIEFPYPDRKEILEILKIHTKDKPVKKDVKLARLADKLEGLTGADISSICNRASILAIKEHLNKRKRLFRISEKHFKSSIEEVLSYQKYNPEKQ